MVPKTYLGLCRISVMERFNFLKIFGKQDKEPLTIFSSQMFNSVLNTSLGIITQLSPVTYHIYVCSIVCKKFRIMQQKQLSKGVLRKMCSEYFCKFTGEHTCRGVISIKLQSYFIEITFWHHCSLVNFMHISRT